MNSSTRWWVRLLPWLITAACFAVLYTRLRGAAMAQGSALLPYLAASFAHVNWTRWLALMIPYCLLFTLIDSLVVTRVISWFNVPVRYADIFPIRASGYILSLLNEQVSKGAIALYLSRRDNVPAWEVGSSMLFIMFCEFYYLLSWASIGVTLERERLPAAFHAIPWLALAAGVFFACFHLFFSGRIAAGAKLRERSIFRAFRQARLWHYAAVLAMRTPLILAAVFVYAQSLRLFGVEVGYGEMLGLLPVVFFGAAVPGPMHSVAILFWVILFPDRPGEMTAFGLVQHNFFILFNAAIGVLFLRRATRQLVEKEPA
jgi:hypothetical protein